MKAFSFLITPTGVTAFINGDHFAVPVDHPNFSRIGDALRAGKGDEALELIDVRSTVRKFILSDRSFALVNDLITLNGDAFSAPVTDKVLDLINDGNAPEPLFNFLRKVRLNPSKTAQDELLLFCVANGFMIDSTGDIVAYKSVRDNYNDIHSNTVANIVGKTVTMPRHKVDDDRDRTCSYGLHFASYEYASTWAGQDNKRLMVLGVNPKNVVSIPSDYDNQKGRCSEYTVLAELAGFGKLPKKAVYDTTDFASTKSARQIAAEAAESLDKFERSIARKFELQDELQNEIDDLNVTIGSIQELGGDVPDAMLAELERKQDVLDRTELSIEDLQDKIDALSDFVV